VNVDEALAELRAAADPSRLAGMARVGIAVGRALGVSVPAIRRAVSDQGAGDGAFRRYLPLIRRAAVDDRNEVKKGVSWALRQIGKRNVTLNADAITLAERILADAERTGSRGARWVARDVLRELRSDAVLQRLG
jgi:3-methyladenine DNA glycosylase AlkD